MTSDPSPPADVPPPSVARFVAIALSIAGLAAVGLIAIVIVFGAPRMGTTGDDPVCLEAYGPDTLANRLIAFDGTVSAIDGEDVTFRVEHAYTGVEGGTVTLSAPGLTSVASPSGSARVAASPAGGTVLTVDQRYLVAGDDGVAWGCGFTRPYDAAAAAEWSSVFAAPSTSIGPSPIG